MRQSSDLARHERSGLVTKGMRARFWILVGLVLAVVAGVIGVIALTGDPGASSPDEADEEATGARADDPEPRRVASAPAPDETARSERRREGETSPESERAPSSESRSARIDRARWNSIVTRLREAREREGAAPESATDEPRGTLDREYIREAVRAVTPLLAECYELARAEDPTLEGRLIVEFTIGGDPEVGGVVEQSAVAEDSALRHPIMDECVRETMYTIELPPPEEGGRVDVRYPFVFSPDEPEETSETQ
jgi:hypothetical protein